MVARISLLAGLVGSLIVPAAASAQVTYSYTTFDYPGVNQTEAYGINDAGRTVGLFAGFQSGGAFLRETSGTFSTLNPPGATFSVLARDINNSDQIVGQFDASGFLYSGGNYTNLNVPGATATGAAGINDLGDIVGTYFTGSAVRGYRRDTAGNYSTLLFPGSTDSQAWGINSSGRVAGAYWSNGGNDHGYTWTAAGGYVPIDVPGGVGTQPTGINDLDQVVGSFGDASGGHGFLLSGGVYTPIDVPGATGGTTAFGINDLGQIVGYYSDANGTHGFIATPAPEPSSFVLVGLAVSGLGVRLRRAAKRRFSP